MKNVCKESTFKNGWSAPLQRKRERDKMRAKRCQTNGAYEFYESFAKRRKSSFKNRFIIVGSWESDSKARKAKD